MKEGDFWIGLASLIVGVAGLRGAAQMDPRSPLIETTVRERQGVMPQREDLIKFVGNPQNPK